MTTNADLIQAPAQPGDLAGLLAQCVAVGDAEGAAQLYAADAVLSLPGGREAAGREAIARAYAFAFEAGVEVPVGAERSALVAGTFACTRDIVDAPDGPVYAQAARLDADGRWRWVSDGSRLVDCLAALGAAAA